MRNQGKHSDLKTFIHSFESIMLNLPIPCCILDLEGTIVLSNESAIQLTGYPKESEFKRNIISQLEDDDIDKAIKHLKNVLLGEQGQFQLSIRHKDGSSIPVQILSLPLQIGGVIQGILGIMIEQTEKLEPIAAPANTP